MLEQNQHIQQLVKYLTTKLREAIIKQEHKATGKLLDSLRIEVVDDAINGYFEDYGQYVDRGRKPGSFPPIEALEAWAKQKNLTLEAGQTYTNVAYAIAKSIYKKGIPSKPYVKWSAGNSLKRVNWMTDTLDKSEQTIREALNKALGEEVGKVIINTTQNKVTFI